MYERLEHINPDGTYTPLTLSEITEYLRKCTTDNADPADPYFDENSPKCQARRGFGIQPICFITNELHDPSNPKSKPLKLALCPWIGYAYDSSTKSSHFGNPDSVSTVKWWIEDLHCHGLELYSFGI